LKIFSATAIVVACASIVGAAGRADAVKPPSFAVPAECNTLSASDVRRGLDAQPGTPVDATAKYPARVTPPNHVVAACRWSAANDPKVTLTFVYANSGQAKAFYEKRVAAAPYSRKEITVVPKLPELAAIYWRDLSSGEQNVLVHDYAAVFQIVTTSRHVSQKQLVALAFSAMARLE
jgi:hypothetical protein